MLKSATRGICTGEGKNSVEQLIDNVLSNRREPLQENNALMNILTNSQVRGLVAMLTGKALRPTLSEESAADSLILSNLKELAEITDMITHAQAVHQGVMNLSQYGADINEDKRRSLHHKMNLGNKLATLVGDYLLANACHRLAALRNPLVVSLMSQAIGDFAEGEFLKYEHVDASSHASEQQLMDSIRLRSYLVCGSLLAHGCKAAAIMSGFGDEGSRTSNGQDKKYCQSTCEDLDILGNDAQTVDIAFNIGRNIGIAFQLSDYLGPSEFHWQTSQLESNGELFTKERTQMLIKRLFKLHLSKALSLIDSLQESEARQSLHRLTMSITEFEDENNSSKVRS
ncbi:All trans-polyprenyl-diphosphate synthase PDSS2 [Halotydeus destructor]|nr:All trans-polyprenyl-diphosphate synthase PDSS2 [Halotydeus destructor]